MYFIKKKTCNCQNKQHQVVTKDNVGGRDTHCTTILPHTLSMYAYAEYLHTQRIHNICVLVHPFPWTAKGSSLMVLQR